MRDFVSVSERRLEVLFHGQILQSDLAFGTFQVLKTWIDDWVSITVSNETALRPEIQGKVVPMRSMVARPTCVHGDERKHNDIATRHAGACYLKSTWRSYLGRDASHQ